MARLKREHLVSAGLVGTVVVVVGFASGLGIRQPDTDTAQAQPPPHHMPPTTATTSSTTTEQPAPPPPATGGDGGYPAGGGGVNFVAQPVPVTTAPSETQYPTRTTNPPSSTATSSTTTTTSPPPCDPGLVRNLTDSVDGTVGGFTGLLGLPSKPLAPVLDPLLGTCQPPASTGTTAATTTNPTP